ncbi:MAG: hypothetical protein ABJF10_26835 [Chthoniobacter sp.]|uniref:hypothetical protein n=1 Tax=Chthoniobacter sp. TaxID=2510640 RepID=UPI0032AE197C
MKSLLIITAVLMSTVATWAKELITNGLLLYREPPGQYVEALRYFSFTQGASDSVAILVTGKPVRVWNSGIIAVLQYPPANVTSVSPENASLMVRQARGMAARLPDYASQINVVVEKWQNAESFATAAARQIALKNAHASSVTLLVGSVRYNAATLSAVGQDDVTIMHANGVAKIPIDALSKDQIVALNKTSTTEKVDPDTLEKRQIAKNSSSDNQQKSGQTVASVPSNQDLVTEDQPSPPPASTPNQTVTSIPAAAIPHTVPCSITIRALRDEIYARTKQPYSESDTSVTFLYDESANVFERRIFIAEKTDDGIRFLFYVKNGNPTGWTSISVMHDVLNSSFFTETESKGLSSIVDNIGTPSVSQCGRFYVGGASSEMDVYNHGKIITLTLRQTDR